MCSSVSVHWLMLRGVSAHLDVAESVILTKLCRNLQEEKDLKFVSPFKANTADVNIPKTGNLTSLRGGASPLSAGPNSSGRGSGDP